MVAGVPMETVGLNLLCSATAFLAGHSLLYLLVAPAVQPAFAVIGRSDPNAFRLPYLVVDTKGRARNVAAASPSTDRRPIRPRPASMSRPNTEGFNYRTIWAMTPGQASGPPARP